MLFKEIEEARPRCAQFASKTPLRSWDYLKRTLKHQAPTLLKLETFQNTGAFKVRGAANKILSLIEAGQKPTHVIAASAGNHAQAVAYVAGKLGVPTTIVMPEGSPLVKAAATRDYGAKVVLHGTIYDDAFTRAQEILKQTPGAVYVHAYEDIKIMAGQGTLGLEVHDQLLEHAITTDDVQIVVPIGGGGLISGVATAMRHLRPRAKIFGVVCEAAPGMFESFNKGQVVQIQTGPRKKTLGEGLAVKKVSELTFEVIKKKVEEIAVVSDDDMAFAIATLMERGKLVTEGSGAAGVAAALSHKFKKLDPSKPTVFVLCGGNIDMNLVSNILERGLSRDGRWLNIRVTVEDKPGQLAKISTLLGDLGANILEIHHDRTSPLCPLGFTRIQFSTETRGREHVDQIRSAIENQGIQVEVLGL
jgi:threonine dehydratase